MVEDLRSRNARIFLAGFMGSGKSTVGPILANTIGYDFVDIDRAIEKTLGRSVREIFQKEGESFFRALEQSTIADICAREGVVVALGGGTLTNPTVLPLIQSSGILVYLKVPLEQLLRRLHNKTDRPLLMDDEGNRLPEDVLRDRVVTLYHAREPLYARADIILLADERRVGLTVDRLVRMLSPVL